MAWRGLLLIHIAWACGWLSYFNLGTGFANAAETTEMKSQIAALRVESIEGKLFDTRLKQCAIEATGTRLEKQYYRERMEKLQKDYWELVGAVFDVPPCE